MKNFQKSSVNDSGIAKWAAIISIAAVAFTFASILIPLTSAHAGVPYEGQKREFWLFNSGMPEFNETMMGMPHDIYSMQTMTVREGDSVMIHFFNTEPSGGDSHSFTMLDSPYAMNVQVAPGQNKTITFEASTVGTFSYFCTFHQPTMRGQLVVEPT